MYTVVYGVRNHRPGYVLIEFKSKENIFLSFFFLKNPDESRIAIEENEIIELDLKKADIFSQVEKEKGEEEFLDEKYQQKCVRLKAYGIGIDEKKKNLYEKKIFSFFFVEIQSGREDNVEEHLAKTAQVE